MLDLTDVNSNGSLSPDLRESRMVSDPTMMSSEEQITITSKRKELKHRIQLAKRFTSFIMVLLSDKIRKQLPQRNKTD